MPDDPKIVLGILPAQFQQTDAPAVIALAAAALACMAAVGNNDPATMNKVLTEASKSYQRMRPEARKILVAATNEMVDAIRAGKGFMVLGGFQQQPG